jgi:hypothetical protein
MRFLMSLILLGLLTFALHAQSPLPVVQKSSELVILRYSWTEERVPGWDKEPSNAEPFDVTMERVANEQRMQQARNSRTPGATTRSETEAKMIEKATVTEKNKNTKERPRFGYRYKMRVRNESAKTIKSIDWDYVFLDKETRQEVSRHLLASDQNISPGKEKDISVFVLTPPIRTVKPNAVVRKDELPFAEKVDLVRIQYSDGSSWQKP